MSTLKTVNIQHPSSASVNAGTDTSGNFLINSGYGSAATAYGCRAWVNFDGTGTTATNQTIRASGNVTSVFKNATGDYTVNMTNAMPDANYAVTFGIKSSSQNIWPALKISAAINTNNFTVMTTSSASTAFDSVNVTAAVFR